MIKTHFEIGENIGFNEGGFETQTVFSASTLSECIEEWKRQKYTSAKYFIDVWETKNDGCPYHKADIKIENWIFKRGD